MSREARYRLLFELAWDDHGLTLVLNDIPDDMLQQISAWRNEKVEIENAHVAKIR
jgi:hypothetical protein